MTLSFITTIDDMFASSLPAEIRTNAANLNKQKSLKITEDQNTYTKIFTRIKLMIKDKMGSSDKETVRWRTQAK